MVDFPGVAAARGADGIAVMVWGGCSTPFLLGDRL